MSSEQFVMWRGTYIEGKCVIKAPYPVKDSYELNRGISRADSWPEDVTCDMDSEFPKDIELADNLYGTANQVISSRLRDALGQRQVTGVEFLPVRILNHKKKVAATDYFILNPPFTVDCIDVVASKVKWNPLNRKLIQSCKALIIDEAKVPSDAQVFRAKYLPMEILVRKRLADSLRAADLTGLFSLMPHSSRGN